MSKDGCIRPGTNMKVLSKLRTPFKKRGGSTTAGNCSQLCDGAALVLLARRSRAEELGFPILAKFTSYTVVGCKPELMGSLLVLVYL